MLVCPSIINYLTFFSFLPLNFLAPPISLSGPSYQVIFDLCTEVSWLSAYSPGVIDYRCDCILKSGKSCCCLQTAHDSKRRVPNKRVTSFADNQVTIFYFSIHQQRNVMLALYSSYFFFILMRRQFNYWLSQWANYISTRKKDLLKLEGTVHTPSSKYAKFKMDAV